MSSIEEEVLSVRLCSVSAEDSVLEIRTADLLAREEQMRAIQADFAISSDRWSSSRLYRALESGQWPMVLDPAEYCRQHNLSHHFQWTSALTTVMNGYYRTGRLNVVDVSGEQLLLGLEFFGILYQPSQLVFESYRSYVDVKEWSMYLSARADLAEAVAEAVVEARGRDVFLVVEPNSCTIQVDAFTELGRPTRKTADILQSKSASPQECFQFFHDLDEDQESSQRRSSAMRDDFEAYFANVLTSAHVRFNTERVYVEDDKETAMRAVLRIRHHHAGPILVEERSCDKSALEYPVDEYVVDDLREGTLEQLVSEVDARTPPATPERPLIHEALSIEQPKEPDPRPTLVCRDMPAATIPAAPVAVIRAPSESHQSVTSALTGPFFLDEDGSLKDVYDSNDVRAEALRHEWIQGSYMNRGISTRVKALLDDATEVEVDEESKPDQWDWLTSFCAHPKLSRNQCSSRKKTLEFVAETATNVLRSVEQGATAMLCADDQPCGAPNRFQKRTKGSTTTTTTTTTTTQTSSPTGSRTGSAPIDTTPPRIKDRLTQLQQAVKESKIEHYEMLLEKRRSERAAAADRLRAEIEAKYGTGRATRRTSPASTATASSTSTASPAEAKASTSKTSPAAVNAPRQASLRHPKPHALNVKTRPVPKPEKTRRRPGIVRALFRRRKASTAI